MQEKELNEEMKRINEEAKRPIELRIRDAKHEILAATFSAMSKHLIPAFAVEGVIHEALASVKEQKYEELLLGQERASQKDVE